MKQDIREAIYSKKTDPKENHRANFNIDFRQKRNTKFQAEDDGGDDELFMRDG